MSRKVYTIKTSACVTVFISEERKIEAPDLKIAETTALEEFRDWIDEQYSPRSRIEGLRVDCTEVAEYER